MGGNEQVVVADGSADPLECTVDHAVVSVRRLGQWAGFDRRQYGFQLSREPNRPAAFGTVSEFSRDDDVARVLSTRIGATVADSRAAPARNRA